MTCADPYGLIDLVRYRGNDCLGDKPLSAFLLQISRTEPAEVAPAIRAIRWHVLAGRWHAAEALAVALVTGKPAELKDAQEALPAAAYAIPAAHGG